MGKEVREAVLGISINAGGENWEDWQKDERQGNSVVVLVEMRVLYGSPSRAGGKNSRNL